MKRFIITCFLFLICFTYKDVQAYTISLNILGTKVDEIVSQASDNTYYLNHNSLGNKDIKGTTFLDYRNKIGDKKLLIYGHNSSNVDLPFKELENYFSIDFYNTHKYIFLTIENNTYIYKIFSVMIADNNEHTRLGFNNVKYQDHLKYLKDKSIYDTKTPVSKNDEILIIQTCNYNPLNTFLVVSAKKMKGEIYEAL